MKRFVHLLLVVFILSVAQGQSRESGVSKSSEETLLAKNKPENVLYTGEQFIVYNVFPNPADTYFDLKYSIPAHITDLKFVVRNVLGNVVYSYVLTHEKGDGIRFSTAQLEPGMYFHTLYQGKKNIITKKLIIKH